MILTDTGPLIALLDKDDAHHADCIVAASRLSSGPLLVAWPCFTEAMYLLGEVDGYFYQDKLWQLRAAQRLILLDLTTTEADCMAALMEKYQDTPMDLADGSIVAVAESRSLHRVFTLDSDFRIYRLADWTALEIVP